VCEASVDTALIEAHWDQSGPPGGLGVETGHASAVTAPWPGSVLRRARGDPIYDAGVQVGKLLRTAFLADYFVNAGLPHASCDGCSTAARQSMHSSARSTPAVSDRRRPGAPTRCRRWPTR
jgi:hypothetical protein